MGRYLAIFNGAATPEQRRELSPQESQAFLERWAAWAGRVGAALADPGAPLYRKIRLTSAGAQPFEDSRTGYAIVEAPSHEAAVQLFADHPHLDLIEGNSIEVFECPEPPS